MGYLKVSVAAMRTINKIGVKAAMDRAKENGILVEKV